MALAEMIVWSVGGGLKFVEVENGRKVSGGSRAQRASFSMVSADLAHSFCMRLGSAADRTEKAVRLSYAFLILVVLALETYRQVNWMNAWVFHPLRFGVPKVTITRSAWHTVRLEIRGTAKSQRMVDL